MKTRDVSSALFGNEKMAEVVLAVVQEHGHTTAQQIAHRLGVNHDLARKPLLRLVAAGLLVALPREGGRRSQQFYEVRLGSRWSALVSLCEAISSAEAFDDLSSAMTPVSAARRQAEPPSATRQQR